MLKTNDSHVHVGQFNDKYFHPKTVCKFLNTVDVEYFAVSSTTVCGGDLDRMINDLYKTIELSSQRALPVLWLTPEILKDDACAELVRCGLNWGCVKMHGYHGWTDNEIEQAVLIANQLNVPFMMHTGGRPCCEAGQYYQLCKNHQERDFILAHSRPCDDAIMIMKNCCNVWADTAFTPLDDIIKMVNAGLEDRILWGSDYPIPALYYKRENLATQYCEKRDLLFKSIEYESYKKIVSENYMTLFNFNIR